MTHKSKPDDAEREHRFREACALQKIENNPLTSEEIAMFDMFRREGYEFARTTNTLTFSAEQVAAALRGR